MSLDNPLSVAPTFSPLVLLLDFSFFMYLFLSSLVQSQTKFISCLLSTPASYVLLFFLTHTNCVCGLHPYDFEQWCLEGGCFELGGAQCGEVADYLCLSVERDLKGHGTGGDGRRACYLVEHKAAQKPFDIFHPLKPRGTLWSWHLVGVFRRQRYSNWGFHNLELWLANCGGNPPELFLFPWSIIFFGL